MTLEEGALAAMALGVLSAIAVMIFVHRSTKEDHDKHK